MKRLKLILVLATAAALLTPVAAQTLAADLQRAIQKETATGDCRGAIRDYQAIVDRAGSNRAVSAQALLKMAGCHEHLGDAEARNIYARIVREYPEQKEAVAAWARSNGTAATKSEEANPRRVWSGTDQAAVSTDGRYLAHQGPEFNALFLRDLTTGAERRLTGIPSAGSRIFWSAFSKDSTEIAYNTCKGAGLTDCELRIVAVRGTDLPTSRRVYASYDAYPVPEDWSPDGRWIAANLRLNDRTATSLALIPTAGGTVRQLKTLEWGSVPNLRFSPDGRDLAVSLQNAKGEADLFLLATDGSSQVPVVSTAGNDTLIGWSPDGKFLLYKNDEDGTHLWAQEIVNRKPMGSPLLVKFGIGGGEPRGLTKTGSLYLGKVRAGWTIEVASVDLGTGARTAPPTALETRSDGHATQPAWSPDGQSLAYVIGSGGAVVAVRSLGTGAVRELHLKPSLANVHQLSWVGDGSAFLVWGRDERGRDGVFRIAMTGDVVPLSLATGTRIGSGGLQFSPDGTRAYYRRDGSYHEYVFESGTDRVVIPGKPSDPGPVSPRISPDGRSVATSWLDPATGASVAIVAPVTGGAPREIFRVKPPERLAAATWTPDGRSVVMMRSGDDDATTRELWLLPVDGTPARKLDVDATRLAVDLHSRIRIHPDGKQVAFVNGAVQKEIWVFENVLASLRSKP